MIATRPERPIAIAGISPARSASPPPAKLPLTQQVLRYVMQHPGCAHSHDKRQWYSDGFRHFVLALRQQQRELALESFAALVGVPQGTLKPWLSVATLPAAPAPELEPRAVAAARECDATAPQIETVLTAWKSWRGNLLAEEE